VILIRWRWLLLDLLLACVVCAAGAGLIREVVEGRSLPPAHELPEPGPRPAAEVPDAARILAGGPRGGAGEYAVIGARNLFAASRGEVAVVAPVLDGGLKAILHGVVIDGARSRAYLDDPVAKRVFGYTVGDAVAGGRLEKILDDRVIIRQADGMVEVLLQDPSKPQADESAPAAAPTKTRRSGSRSGLEPPSPVPATPPSPEPAAPSAPGQVPR
jgi:hypothetical protein